MFVSLRAGLIILDYIRAAVILSMRDIKDVFKIFLMTYTNLMGFLAPGGHSQAQNNQDNTVTLLIGSFAGVILVVVSISVVVCLIRHKKPAKQPKKRIILLSPVSAII